MGKWCASRRYVVLGAESGTPERKEHNHHAARDACLRRALAELAALWPKSKAWRHYHAGFSGGAKNCFYLAAYVIKEMQIEPLGFFLGGANELKLEDACKELKIPKTKFDEAAYFLSNGASDKIAPVSEGEEIAAELRRLAKNVRFEMHEGGHSLNRGHVEQALDWFVELESKSR